MCNGCESATTVSRSQEKRETACMSRASRLASEGHSFPKKGVATEWYFPEAKQFVLKGLSVGEEYMPQDQVVQCRTADDARLNEVSQSVAACDVSSVSQVFDNVPPKKQQIK